MGLNTGGRRERSWVDRPPRTECVVRTAQASQEPWLDSELKTSIFAGCTGPQLPLYLPLLAISPWMNTAPVYVCPCLSLQSARHIPPWHTDQENFPLWWPVHVGGRGGGGE